MERGLHIQLGEAGAKTGAQLGDEQLEAAKRLRRLLATNKCGRVGLVVWHHKGSIDAWFRSKLDCQAKGSFHEIMVHQ